MIAHRLSQRLLMPTKSLCWQRRNCGTRTHDELLQISKAVEMVALQKQLYRLCFLSKRSLWCVRWYLLFFKGLWCIKPPSLLQCETDWESYDYKRSYWTRYGISLIIYICIQKYLERKSKHYYIREAQANGLTCWNLKSKTESWQKSGNDNGPTLALRADIDAYRLWNKID